MESRKTTLEEEYRIQIDEQLSEEMSAVCNLAEGIARMNRAQGMAQGMAQGRAQGEEMLGTLVNKMLSIGRVEDAKRAATDPAYREEQYKVYNIGQESASQA